MTKRGQAKSPCAASRDFACFYSYLLLLPDICARRCGFGGSPGNSRYLADAWFCASAIDIDDWRGYKDNDARGYQFSCRRCFRDSKPWKVEITILKKLFIYYFICLIFYEIGLKILFFLFIHAFYIMVQFPLSLSLFLCKIIGIMRTSILLFFTHFSYIFYIIRNKSRVFVLSLLDIGFSGNFC